MWKEGQGIGVIFKNNLSHIQWVEEKILYPKMFDSKSVKSCRVRTWERTERHQGKPAFVSPSLRRGVEELLLGSNSWVTLGIQDPLENKVGLFFNSLILGLGTTYRAIVYGRGLTRNDLAFTVKKV